MRIFRTVSAVTASLLAALLMFGSAAAAVAATDAAGSQDSAVSTQSFDEPTDSGGSSESDDSSDSSDSSSGSGDESDSSTQAQSEPQATSAASTNAATGVYADISGSSPVPTGSPQPAGSTPDPTGTFVFPGIVNAPSGTYAVAPDAGSDTPTVFAFPQPDINMWIPADTPFGSIFGASGPTGAPLQPVRIPPTSTGRHLQVFGFGSGPTAGTFTTISFAKPMFAGAWGFALVGIDIENAIIGGLDANGNALTGAQLGGATFDVCTSADAPPTCNIQNGGPSAADAGEPSWDAATSTCSGAGAPGGTCWFRPTAAVRTITLRVLNPNSGFVSFALWLAALKADLGVDIGFPAGSPAQPVDVELFGPDGELLGTQTATGSAVFRDLLAAAGYLVRIAPPKGFKAVDGDTRLADLSAGSTTVAFQLAAPTVHPQSGEVTLASFGALPTTGADSDVPAFVAVVLLVVGGVLLGATRRRFA